MTFQSPWQSGPFVQLVALIRRVLRPWATMEERFVAALTTRQNERVHRYLKTHPPGKILLIMPRCVKKTGCPADVKRSLAQCVECRECPLGDVSRLCRRHDIEALVAFRSHIAFAMAREVQPDLIIATACHDRLIKALRSVPEIPALLAPLIGMEKMCVGAQVDLSWLEEQLGRASQYRVGSPTAVSAEIPHDSSAGNLDQASSATGCQGIRQ